MGRAQLHGDLSRKGEWLTDPTHLPASYKQMSEWNAPYFTRKAMTVGPYTVKVIEHVLKSREHEVQTYCLCMGMEKRSELSKLTIICSQREPNSWASMILNDEVSVNSIMKRATKHYTVVIKPKE